MKKILISLVFVALVAPQIALASWWNPFTWKIFTKPTEVPIEEPKKQIIEVEDQKAIITATSTVKVEQPKREVAESKKESIDSRASEIAKLKKEVEELKRVQSTIQVVVKQPVPPPEIAKVTKPVVLIVPQVEEKKMNTVSFPNGSVAEIDTSGNIVRWIKEVPQQAYISPTSTQDQVSVTVQISSINVVATVNSARIEWQTNTPTNSKVFLSGWMVEGAKADERMVRLQEVYNSESGLSTRHMVNVSGLSSGTNYSYEIESINGNQQVAKKVGLFTTNAPKPDEYTISVQPDKISVPASGWHSVSIKVSTLKNGQSQSNQNVLITTPDSSQNRSSSNGNNTFTYYPKTVGAHKLDFSWNGVTKSVDIQATSYQKVEQITLNVLDSNVIIPLGTTNYIIGKFTLSGSDELTRITKATLDSTSQKNLIGFWDGSTSIGQSGGTVISFTGERASDSLTITLRSSEVVDVGKHTITINSIEMIGQNSGTTRQVSGLPITFHYEVQ
ncbi:MAG: hypothetical protein AAB552_00765 [Patescibacteria group bacterium]